jgi:hypothetical protein
MSAKGRGDLYNGKTNCRLRLAENGTYCSYEKNSLSEIV